jgi:hypothetical protein
MQPILVKKTGKPALNAARRSASLNSGRPIDEQFERSFNPVLTPTHAGAGT